MVMVGILASRKREEHEKENAKIIAKQSMNAQLSMHRSPLNTKNEKK